MPRNQVFEPVREPFRHDPDMHLEDDRVTGPFSFLNPTRARFRLEDRPDFRFKWTSRDNRKGRHAVVIEDGKANATLKSAPRSTTSFNVVSVANAFFVWLPLVRPDTEFKNEELYGGGITVFVSATVFIFGAILQLEEAVNENSEGCFGWAVETALERVDEDEAGSSLQPAKAECSHHHLNKRNLVGQGCSSSKTLGKATDSKDRSWV
ncbi:hypothetical protein NX059_006460 [Plenodomus lindquistii]|nr:hypothetical protein NX059_006460 [Plenodomus lindquistii]